MKKIVSATDLGGAPFYKNDMREVFNSEIWDVIESMLSKFDADTEGIIVSGCIFTANGSNFDMTAGIVYLNGDFMRIAAATNQTFTKYIAPATPISDSRTFANGNTFAVTQTKNAELVSSAPGSGQYITVDTLTGADDRKVTIKDSEVTTSKIADSAVTAAKIATDAVTTSEIQNGAVTNDKITNGAWTNIALANGWLPFGSATPQYRVDVTGRVHLRGKLDPSASSSGNITADGAIPSPPDGVSFVQPPLSNASADGVKVLNVSSAGRLQVATDYYSTLLTGYRLEGMSYWTDAF